LGCRSKGRGFEDVRRHPWFKSIDWDALEAKEAQPPFVPDASLFPILGMPCPRFLQGKQSNFDVSHELDEFLMVEKPLTHTKRKATDLDKLKPELRYLEEQCVDYSCFSDLFLNIPPTALPFMISPDQNACLTTRIINQWFLLRRNTESAQRPLCPTEVQLLR